MNKDLKLIKKKYLSLVEELKKNNKLYYEKSDPKISDSEYDKLKIKIFDLEKKFKFLKNKGSPSISVGFKPSKNFLLILSPHQILLNHVDFFSEFL